MGETPEQEKHALSRLLDALAAEAKDKDHVSVEALVEALGRRSFPALVLAPSLLAMSPASGIPGVTGTAGLMVATITGQMLFGRECAWLPGFLTRRKLSARRLCAALGWLRRPVGWLEALARPRLGAMLYPPLVSVPLVAMLAISLAMPVMEVIPMSGSIAGALLSVFAVGLLVRDGALLMLALAFSAIAPLAAWQLAS